MTDALTPLEDDPCDVLKKAMRGTDTSIVELAAISGLSLQLVSDLLNGLIDKQALRTAGDSLGLNGAALSQLDGFRPDCLSVDGLHAVISPFGHAGVNAYIIEHGHTATVIDTGTDATAILKLVEDRQLRISQVLITHQHHDHTACLHTFEGIPIIKPEDLEHGDKIETESGDIAVLDVSGHAQPARAYYFDFMECPVCTVGDSLFAGSMGGTTNPNRYQLALQTAISNIMTLPEKTVLCPGHGPLTDVATERFSNPFLNIV